MQRNYEIELKNRVEYIRAKLAESHSSGIVFGNSGGKDSALVGILCVKACADTTGIIMPCQSKRNFESDRTDALEVAEQFGIKTVEVDLTAAKEALVEALSPSTELTNMSMANMNPRLRMITLYSYAQANSALVAGTGNRSEGYVGYFTKWGDGGYDFNPISDLTVTEVYEFLAYLNAPTAVRTKAPSAALFEGQTDEAELGFTYAELDDYLLKGAESISPAVAEKIERMHRNSEHKRKLPSTFISK